MSKPEISIENRDLYPWYVDFERDPRAVNIGTTVMSWMQPQLHYGLYVREEIMAHTANDGVLALNGSHQNITDQFHVASFPRKDPEVFGELEGKARIGAKDVLFMNALLRYGVEQMGAFPATRRKDIVKRLGRDLTEEEEILLALNQAEFKAASVTMLDNGQDLMNFPQGTRTNEMKIKGGMGEIAVATSDETNLALLPFGIYYPKFRGTNLRNLVKPHVFFDRLIYGPFTDPNDVTEQLSRRISYSVAQARVRSPRYLYSR